MNKKKYILVLDLDETLFHTSGNNLYIRPGCVDFIKSLYPHFYLIVFTAATKNYADEMLDKIGISNYFLKKFYRQHLTKSGYKDLKTVLRSLIQEKVKYHNKIIKGSSNLKKSYYMNELINISNNILFDKYNNINYNNIIIIDNLVENFKDSQSANGINIIDFTIDKKDNCLKMIKEFLLQMVFLKTKNVREYLCNNLFIISKYIKYIPTSNFTIPINKLSIKKNSRTSISKDKKKKKLSAGGRGAKINTKKYNNSIKVKSKPNNNNKSKPDNNNKSKPDNKLKQPKKINK